MSTPNSNPLINLGPQTDIGAVAGAVQSGVDLVEQIDKEENTPENVAAARENEKQARIDALNKAIAEGDVETIRKMAQP